MPLRADGFIGYRQLTARLARGQIDVGIACSNEYATRYQLDGASDVICLLVADIRHQDRANSPAIIAALKRADPAAALLKPGSPIYDSRIKILKREIKALMDDGTLSKRNYSIANQDFVLSPLARSIFHEAREHCSLDPRSTVCTVCRSPPIHRVARSYESFPPANTFQTRTTLFHRRRL